MLISSQNMNFSRKSRDVNQFETSRKSRLDVEKSRSQKPSRLLWPLYVTLCLGIFKLLRVLTLLGQFLLYFHGLTGFNKFLRKLCEKSYFNFKLWSWKLQLQLAIWMTSYYESLKYRWQMTFLFCWINFSLIINAPASSHLSILPHSSSKFVEE